MDRRHEPQMPLLWMTFVAGLIAAPLLALAHGQAKEETPMGALLASHSVR